MTQFTPLHLAISAKLGWGDMLAKIALPAIDTIVSHFIGFIFDATGDVLRPNHAAEFLINRWDSDSIFGLLWLNELGYADSPEFTQFISLRGEIEAYMRRGYNYQEAIAEWFK
jgi:hypothetical protein